MLLQTQWSHCPGMQNCSNGHRRKKNAKKLSDASIAKVREGRNGALSLPYHRDMKQIKGCPWDWSIVYHLTIFLQRGNICAPCWERQNGQIEWVTLYLPSAWVSVSKYERSLTTMSSLSAKVERNESLCFVNNQSSLNKCNVPNLTLNMTLRLLCDTL